MAIRVELRLEAEVPLADEPRGIPGILQELRQRTARRRQADVESGPGVAALVSIGRSSRTRCW